MIANRSWQLGKLVIFGLLPMLIFFSVPIQAPDANGEATETTAAEDTVAEETVPVSEGLAPEHKRALAALAIGIVVVLGLIIGLKVNAFIALITAAIIVSMIAPGDWGEKITRVALAFGKSAGNIGIVIAMAAIIGKCMLDSGAADRIVRAFMSLLGQALAPVALMLSGFVLAVPVFFDTVFYLLVPLARSLHRRTNTDYLKYILAIAAGGAITHTLVPPTPGPLVMASQLHIDIGTMILVGALVAFPAALGGVAFAFFAQKFMPVPMRPIPGMPEPDPLKEHELPPLWLSFLPIVLPVLMIASDTICKTLVDNGYARLEDALPYTAIIGNPSLALLLAGVIAILMVAYQRKLSRNETASLVELSLMSGGVIILITAGGGAFGEMLKAAQVGDAIKSLFAISENGGSAGLMILVLGFGLAAVLKFAQGSSTIAMITGSAMLAGIAQPETLGFNPVYLATAIGGGSLVGSWMNDSGFWIFAKMGGLTETEALKSWTVMLVILGVISFAMSVILAVVMPMV